MRAATSPSVSTFFFLTLSHLYLLPVSSVVQTPSCEGKPREYFWLLADGNTYGTSGSGGGGTYMHGGGDGRQNRDVVQ